MHDSQLLTLSLTSPELSEKNGTSRTRTSSSGWCAAFPTGAVRWSKPEEDSENLHSTGCDRQIRLKDNWVFLMFQRNCWVAASCFCYVFNSFQTFSLTWNTAFSTPFYWRDITRFVVRFWGQKHLQSLTDCWCNHVQFKWDEFISSATVDQLIKCVFLILLRGCLTFWLEYIWSLLQ